MRQSAFHATHALFALPLLLLACGDDTKSEQGESELSPAVAALVRGFEFDDSETVLSPLPVPTDDVSILPVNSTLIVSPGESVIMPFEPNDPDAQGRTAVLLQFEGAASHSRVSPPLAQARVSIGATVREDTCDNLCDTTYEVRLFSSLERGGAVGRAGVMSILLDCRGAGTADDCVGDEPVIDLGTLTATQADAGTPNALPLAEAGDVQQVAGGEPVTLTGIADDPDGTVAETTWEQILESADGADAVDLIVSGATASFEAPVVADVTSLTFRFTVTDDAGDSSFDDVVVTILPPSAADAPPLVDAGQVQQVDGSAAVLLAGVASDGDGVVDSTSWVQVGGPMVTLVIDGGEATFVAPDVDVVTNLVFQFSATDDAGNTTISEVVVTVLPLGLQNAPPLVDAGATQQVDEAALVTLVGTASDADGTVASTAWVQTGGPAVVLSIAGDEASFTAPLVNMVTSLSFRFSATDDTGDTSTDEVVVTVVPTLVPPVAIGGGDQTVDEDVLVTLMGTDSDADGAVVTRMWEQRSGPAVSLSGSDADVSFLTPPVVAATVLTFGYVVMDDDGLSGEDTVAVTVLPVNAPPTVDGGSDISAAEGAMVALVATAIDPDGSIASQQWTQIGGPMVTLIDADQLAVSFIAPVVAQPTTIVLEISVTDDEGASSSDVVLVSIDPFNAAPTVDAGPDQVKEMGQPVELDGTAQDSDGSIASWEWRQLFGTPVVLSDSAIPNPTFTAPDVGSSEVLRFELKVTDNEGATAVSHVDIIVSPPPNSNIPPLAYAGPDQAVGEGSLVQLQGEESDNDGAVVARIWTEVTGSGAVLTGATTLTPTFNAPVADCALHLVFELEVQDDEGGRHTDRVSVTVVENLGGKLPPPVVLDLELDDGGITTGGTPGTAWGWGVPATGPLRAHTGSRVWATGLNANYPNSAADWLCLPAIDMDGVAKAVLSFRIWMQTQSNDGVRVQALDPAAGWTDVTVVTPAYDDGVRWRTKGYVDQYELVMAELPGWVGLTPQLRILFDSTASSNAAGAFIDDIRIDDEYLDVDGDQLVGIMNEFENYGTDPFDPDSDGDGVADGDEVAAGSNPLNGASLPGGQITPPTLLDLEDVGAGGLVTDGVLWEHGVPTSGPGVAYSGINVWATNLTGNFFLDAEEYLYLPEIDLSAGGDATLSFRLSSTSGARMGIEIFLNGAWSLLPVFTPAYNTTDKLGHAAYGTVGYFDQYELVLASLAQFSGQFVQIRLSTRTQCCGTDAGAYVDDIRVDWESDDADGDGILGVIGERLQAGTDPFVADTDGDGDSDGAEYASGDDPLDPSSGSGAQAMLPGDRLGLEADDGGLATTGSLWEWGSISSGPLVGHNDGDKNAWATNLDGNYFVGAVEYLNLPPIDLSAANDATLSFRLWSAISSGALSLEVLDEDAGWLTLPVQATPYTKTDPVGNSGWGNEGYRSNYELVAASLAGHSGQLVSVRLAIRTACCGTQPGSYIDEIRLDEEASDPDGDGVAGILDEVLVLGTDPFVADTDGDGDDDGAEQAAGTPPLNPAYGVSTVPLTAESPGAQLSLELDDGGMATNGELWQWGSVNSGPAKGHGDADQNAWGTNLGGDFFGNAREYLYFPPMDLTAATDPTLSFRLHGRFGPGAVSLEVYDDVGGWLGMPVHSPEYNTTDNGAPAWGAQGYLDNYVLATASLAGRVGEVAQVRLTVGTWCCGTSAGAYIDEVRLNEEADDPDGDGLPGISDELLAHGTDPFVADTDGDGESDGFEVNNGGAPLNPAYGASIVGLVVGGALDLDGDDGGLYTDGTLWEYGDVMSGPLHGYPDNELQAWGTNLSGDTFYPATEYLYLPPLDLDDGGGVIDPTLSFRLWSRGRNGKDTLSVEFKHDVLGWLSLAPAAPVYDEVGPGGAPGYGDWGYLDNYVLMAVPLTDHVNERLQVRFVFRSECCGTSAGHYIDDIRLSDELVDNDGDGILGVLGEMLQEYPTDPFTPDTDGDGVNDGVELMDGSNATVASDYNGGPLWTPGAGAANLSGGDDGGLWTDGTLWEFGPPQTNGPCSGACYAHTDTNVWATDLDATIFPNAIEYLYLPPMDLTSTPLPVLSFWAHCRNSSSDAMSVEVNDPVVGWTNIASVTPNYTDTDALGFSAWRTLGVTPAVSGDDYASMAVDLSNWAGGGGESRLLVRLAYRSTSNSNDWGCYLDDFSLD